MYDCPSELGETLASRGVGTAKNCCLSICGISTPTDLAPFLKKSAHWGNGVWARFIFVTPTWEKPPYVFYPEAMEIPAHLPDTLNQLAFSRLPMPQDNKWPEEISVSLSSDVFELWKRYDFATRYQMVNSKELGNRYKSSYKRLPVMLMKTAILLASMDWVNSKLSAPAIEKSHFAQAYRITESWRESLHRLIEVPNRDGQDEPLDIKALKFIPVFASNAVITERELSINLNMSDAEDRPKLDALVIRMKKDKLITERSVKAIGANGRQYSRTGLCQSQNL
jgi:hypothetical protein